MRKGNNAKSEMKMRNVYVAQTRTVHTHTPHTVHGQKYNWNEMCFAKSVKCITITWSGLGSELVWLFLVIHMFHSGSHSHTLTPTTDCHSYNSNSGSFCQQWWKKEKKEPSAPQRASMQLMTEKANFSSNNFRRRIKTRAEIRLTWNKRDMTREPPQLHTHAYASGRSLLQWLVFLWMFRPLLPAINTYHRRCCGLHC